MTTATVPNYLDEALPVADRIADLLGRMTVEEKVGQMMQLDARDDLDDHVLRKHVGSILHTSPERVLRARELTLQTRLRIPLLVGEDCIHGHSFWEGATIFPTQLGMAASWDADLVERVARATAVEVAATGIHWTFSPVLCIARDLRWGRVDETFGEDPLLIGELASAMVRGYQGGGLVGPHRDPRDGEALRRLLRDAGRTRRERGRPVAPQAALVVPAAVRAGGEGGMPHLHDRLPEHRRRADHCERLAAQ